MPEKGTVGASGDLAPLSHLALGMMGEGKMWSPKSGWADAKYVSYIKENIYANTKTSFSFQNVCNKHNNAEIVITDLSYIRKLEKHSVTFLF